MQNIYERNKNCLLIEKADDVVDAEFEEVKEHK